MADKRAGAPAVPPGQGGGRDHGVPQRTICHLAETGRIPCRRLGTVILLPAAWDEQEPKVLARR